MLSIRFKFHASLRILSPCCLPKSTEIEDERKKRQLNKRKKRSEARYRDPWCPVLWPKVIKLTLWTEQELDKLETMSSWLRTAQCRVSFRSAQCNSVCTPACTVWIFFKVCHGWSITQQRRIKVCNMFASFTNVLSDCILVSVVSRDPFPLLSSVVFYQSDIFLFILTSSCG